MNVNIKHTTHPFLDGRPKRLLIDGKWLEAASGRTFATINPATGEELAQVAEGHRSCRRRRAPRLRRPLVEDEAL